MRTVLLCLALIIAMASADFLPGRLRIVDSNSKFNNFLVRGNLPIKNK